MLGGLGRRTSSVKRARMEKREERGAKRQPLATDVEEVGGSVVRRDLRFWLL